MPARAQLSAYETGGIAIQVKIETKFQHQSLAQQLVRGLRCALLSLTLWRQLKPEFNSHYMDFSKFGRSEQLHLALLVRVRQGHAIA